MSLTSPCENAALDGRADGDDLVGVDALVGLLAEDLLGDLLRLGHAGRATDEHDLVDLAGVELGVLEGLEARGLEALEEVVAQRLELGARERDLQVLGTVLIGRDERQVDRRLLHRRELDLGLLGGFLEALEGHRVLADVDAFLLAELLGEEVDEALVPVVAAQVRVAVGREHLEDAVADVEDRDVEGTAAKVEDRDLLVLLLVEAVGEGRGGGLVDDALDLEAGDLAGVLGRLALGIVEVGGTVMTARSTFSPR
jgi:hypothetical protein